MVSAAALISPVLPAAPLIPTRRPAAASTDAGHRPKTCNRRNLGREKANQPLETGEQPGHFDQNQLAQPNLRGVADSRRQAKRYHRQHNLQNRQQEYYHLHLHPAGHNATKSGTFSTFQIDQVTIPPKTEAAAGGHAWHQPVESVHEVVTSLSDTRATFLAANHSSIDLPASQIAKTTEHPSQAFRHPQLGQIQKQNQHVHSHQHQRPEVQGYQEQPYPPSGPFPPAGGVPSTGLNEMVTTSVTSSSTHLDQYSHADFHSMALPPQYQRHMPHLHAPMTPVPADPSCSRQHHRASARVSPRSGEEEPGLVFESHLNFQHSSSYFNNPSSSSAHFPLETQPPPSHFQPQPWMVPAEDNGFYQYHQSVEQEADASQASFINLNLSQSQLDLQQPSASLHTHQDIISDLPQVKAHGSSENPANMRIFTRRNHQAPVPEQDDDDMIHNELYQGSETSLDFPLPLVVTMPKTAPMSESPIEKQPVRSPTESECSDSSSLEPGMYKRRAFKEDARKQTAATRKSRACIRCRIQRIRCVPNLTMPFAACLTCIGVDTTSKKVIHRQPCQRIKITDVTLFRTGDLKITKRWEGVKIVDVGDWVSDQIRVVKMTQGLCSVGITLNVRKFKPRPGDVLNRSWSDGPSNNLKKVKQLEPYALANVNATATEFQQYISTYAMQGMMEQLQKPGVDEIIRMTYHSALNHYYALQDETQEKKYMANFFQLWFAIRHTVGSSWICSEDTLDMEPETKDESYPLFGKVSTPRMILAQFDSVNSMRLLRPLRIKVLRDLQTFVHSSNPRYFFTVYVSIFILLHEISVSSTDRERHARQNCLSTRLRYSLPDFVESLHEGGNIMLSHWHYYKRDVDPLDEDFDMTKRHKTWLSDLSPEQSTLVIGTWGEMDKWHKSRWGISAHQTREYGHQYFWISQMFDNNWEPGPIFKAPFY